MKRVTFNQIAFGVQDHIFENYGKLDKLQRQLSSGKKLERPSDDPIGVANALDIRNSLTKSAQYQRNINDATAYMSTVETSLSNNNDLFQRAHELAIQGSNDTLNAENRGFIGREVQSLFEQMVALSNSTFRGDYLFSGTHSEIPPYDLADGQTTLTGAELNGGTVGTAIQLVDANKTDANTVSGNPDAYYLVPGTVAVAGFTEGRDFSVDYVNGSINFTAPGAAAIAQAGGAGLGITFTWLRRNEADLDGVIKREIEQDNVIPINLTASEVYGSPSEETSWKGMIRLMEGLHLNNGDKIRDGMDRMDTGLRRNLTAQARNGARSNQIEVATKRMQDTNIGLTDLQSKLEDVDFAAAMTQLSLQQAVYEASLRMGAKAIQNTLANYL